MDVQYNESSMVSCSDNSSSDLEYKTCGKIAQLVLKRLEYLVDGLDTLPKSAYQGEKYGCHSRSSPVQTDNSKLIAESQDHGQDSESMDDSEVSTHKLGQDQDSIEEKYKGQVNLDEHGQCSDHYSHHPIEMIVLKPEEVVGEGEEEQNGRIIEARLQVKKEEMEEDTLMHNESSPHYPSYRSTIELHTQQPQNNELDQDQVFIEGKYKGQDNLNEHGQCSDHYSHHPIEMIVLKPEEVVGEGEQNGGLVDEGPHVKKEDPLMHIVSFTSHSSYRSTIKPHTQEHLKVEDLEGIETGKTNEKYHSSSTMMQIQDFSPNSNTTIDNFKSENESNVMNTLHIGEEPIGNQESSTFNKGVNESTGISLLTQTPHVHSNKSYNSDYETNKKFDLNKHSHTHTGERPYSCELCDKTFNQKSNLTTHLYTHTGERPYSCELCDKTFNQKSNLIAHLRTHTGERPYSCELCDKTFNQKSNLSTHLCTHTGERPFSCELCDKTFNQKSNLSKHVRTHTGERPFSCDFCNRTFNNKSHLTTHLYTHTGERPYSCEFCDKTFNQKSILNRHLYTHTGEGPHNCEFCDKTFNQKSNLIAHLRTHTGERPFSCDFCNRTFNQKSNLSKHVRTHTGERPYSCEFCDKTFNQKSYLNKHLRRHT